MEQPSTASEHLVTPYSITLCFTIFTISTHETLKQTTVIHMTTLYPSGYRNMATAAAVTERKKETSRKRKGENRGSRGWGAVEGEEGML